ncbi:DNA repair protein RecN [candidate division BRC1 bacterium HGW-BRC1-1]|jgi:DNA repair protein RecN (Recombination protein N)|nr:MAG: DNA repair protein RecN [candidate division BRC1 bacterium HGW-BRC1-1]
MLEYLSITNYAIIENLRLEPGVGFNTITGETGAGKSILLGALKLALGERAAAEALRRGSTRSEVEAVFRGLPEALTQRLSADGLADDSDEGCVILRREISSSGTSRAFLNGRTVPLTYLREVAEALIDIHSQNEHTSLHTVATQLNLLDRFGEHESALENYANAFHQMREAKRRLGELDTNQGDAERRKAFLLFQIEEIRTAAPVPGEDETLADDRRRLLHAERIGTACSAVVDLLYEGEQTQSPAVASVDSARKLLEEVAELDPSQTELAARAGEVRFALEDLAGQVRDYMAGIAPDPARLSEVDERLHQLHGLKRKYGDTLAAVLETLESLEAEVHGIEFHDEEMQKCREEFVSSANKALLAARELSERRRKAAAVFEKAVMTEMADLELPRAKFVVRLNSHVPEAGSESSPESIYKALDARGGDDIDFLVSTNIGEDPKPLARVASGGEVARIMLAIKTVLAERDEIPTLVFDEIDVGISGEAAARVGEKLRLLAATHQVLCITHLPQVAARGHVHWVVEKSDAAGRTTASARQLKEKERVLALAQMLSGREPDQAALRYARELMAAQANTKG